MRRAIPIESAHKIILYMRTYYSLLRTTEEVQIRTLEETHTSMAPSLHKKASKMEPDTSAFIYSSLRLPFCIRDVRLVVMGQTEEVFQRRGYTDVESWQPVSAPGRRRRMLYDGEETLAAYIASISDVDDLMPILVAFQIEWNKMHHLLSLHRGLAERLAAWAESGEPDATLQTDTLKALQLSPDDWARFARAWQDNLPHLLCDIAHRRKRMAVRLLAGTYVDYRRATQRWWWHVTENAPVNLFERPVYFVSSNTHSMTNMLTGFAQRHERALLDYLHTEAPEDLREEAERIRQGEVPSSWDNFLYYVLKKYLSRPESQEMLEERSVYETEHGITRIPSSQTFDLEAQVIELYKINPEHVDGRLQDLPLEALADSRAVILNIDYPLGFAAYHLLTRVAASAGSLRGFYALGKAATLNGRLGDVLIPNVVYDEHSQNTYLLNNVFDADHIARYLVYGDVLDNQRAITVRGTFLQNDAYMRGFLNAGYTDAEMEAGPYLSGVYEFIRPRRYPTNEIVNLYPIPFEIGILHYASDTPITKGKNLSHNLSYYGMDPTYATTVAVLRRILALETKGGYQDR
ncbi:MAG: DUF6909 family protein [Anaerolineae bacterium]